METENYASRWVSRAIEAAGITQAELAKRIGMDRIHLNRVVNGKIDPTVSSMVEMVEAAGFEIIELRVKRKEQAVDGPGK